MHKNRFYVYIHKVSIPFTLDNIFYDIGTVVYVGSGTAGRYRDTRGRTKKHLSIFENLEKIILLDNLTFDEKLDEEDRLLRQYADSEFLFNVKKRVSRNIRLDYNELSELFYLSTDSKSNLKWKKGKYKDRDVGCLCSSTGYWVTKFKNKNIQCHRIVYTLHIGKTFDEKYIVDHINGSRSDNNPSNLRLVDHSGNCRNNSQTSGVRLEKKRSRWISYISLHGKQICKAFNIKKCFPDDTIDVATERTRLLALTWRKNMAETHNIEVRMINHIDDVFWFYEDNDWRYRYELYEQGVDMSREFLVYYHGSEEYREFFSNLVDYNNSKDEVK